MKDDTQHLDFLISQYVDGCLDSASRKSVEQHLVRDPAARKLYQEHREVQDTLDDWGSRIPLIDWDAFNTKLAGRLEREAIGRRHVSAIRRWSRPLSVAAGLVLAASLGYAFHGYLPRDGAMPRTNSVAGANAAPRIPGDSVHIEQDVAENGVVVRQVRIDDGQFGVGGAVASRGHVTVSAPGDVAAADALQTAVMSGLSNVANAAMPQAQAGSVSAMVDPSEMKKQDHDNNEGLPAFP